MLCAFEAVVGRPGPTSGLGSREKPRGVEESSVSETKGCGQRPSLADIPPSLAEVKESWLTKLESNSVRGRVRRFGEPVREPKGERALGGEG